MEVSGETGEETPVSEETQRDGGVYRRILSYTGISTGLLKLNLVGTETALLTEIQVLDSAGDSLLGTLLDTSLFDTVTDIPTTTTTTTETTASGVPPSAGSSSAVTSQPPVPTSVTSDNSTSVATTDAPVGTAVIAAVLSVVVLALLVLLAAVLLAVFLLLWRRRRGRRDKGAKQTLQMHELGLYDPITKQRTNDPYYELPVGVGVPTEDREYANIEVCWYQLTCPIYWLLLLMLHSV